MPDIRHSASSSALVLNATYEPLGVVSVRRATILILSAKAVCLADGEGILHSERAVLAGATGGSTHPICAGSLPSIRRPFPSSDLRAGRRTLCLLPRSGGDHRPRHATQPWRWARLGQRGRRVRSVQSHARATKRRPSSVGVCTSSRPRRRARRGGCWAIGHPIRAGRIGSTSPPDRSVRPGWRRRSRCRRSQGPHRPRPHRR